MSWQISQCPLTSSIARMLSFKSLTLTASRSLYEALRSFVMSCIEVLSRTQDSPDLSGARTE